MANRFHILGSSSSGNCSIIETDDSIVMIDAGFSAKKIEELMQPTGLTINDIDAVFITHEHSDHAIGLRGLSRKRPELPFFANQQTAHTLQENLPRKLNWQIFETGSSFRFENFEVSNFAIPHDAYDPVGFVFEIKNPVPGEPNQRVAWATDLGYIPGLVQERIFDVEILVLEANYDLDLLDNNLSRPWSLKQRIKGRHGHLSNADSFEYISNKLSPHWKKIFLAHLSKDCNDICRVNEQFAPLDSHSSFNINIVDPTKSHPLTCDLN
ncbi:MAG: MBL fold metallo-hydrolase [Verrucomicrobia bacterium CG_4_10_14_3_um_filter_43_23]|nr:MAG: hypothetical protein AUJ82_04880 [Verrucomicrobia bacterium CG1_02_43_26]PIP58972.1 MAG: MBL fold metallo-hydrolase [Verrucomicrobia bacterium CG22_combo_CG10-13_8_21_14_all_43_17]PIX59070.1 MAG: MBL fold metallo-hydrolase [Verrucomicrobia bacterium CG_4_10_14_3_um_filter_43_23]PIY61408.1 MAG: MBL fold metallo-hydrolase [Verrucomicrobia bacterium CG_4_10_14_0_8_um_filter_43_34]PJA44699.1 MAG: MBL fold metallo-hydrolase [Verrucomicrobia bacterium CG_4_9_14_3_um_filter_43_20]